MIRSFPEHTIRSVLSLDGLWEFLPECDDKVMDLPENYTRVLETPSVWESLPDLRKYRGRGWYRRSVQFPGGNLRLAFGGVSHSATVYVNGEERGTHYDAFTPWDVIVPDLEAGSLDVVVEVDNTFGPHSTLHIPNDYYTYGGITRPVELHVLPDVYIQELHVTPRAVQDGWELDVHVRIHNFGEDREDCKLELMLPEIGEGKELELDTLPSGESEVVFSCLEHLDVEPWAESTPNLYMVVATLIADGKELDDKIDRVGFREVRVDGHRLLLNGEELRLRGFNRHEDHPQFGCAATENVMAYDLGLFENLNANFLRTCHYPNDQRILDMCDERGIYVWEESHSRQTPFNPPKFQEQILQNTREMIAAHRNHPSIVIWGSLNECDTRSRKGYEVHKEVLNLIRDLDDSRPVTYAANHKKEDTCLGLADIVSLNFYVGWYELEAQECGEYFADFLQWLDSDKSHGAQGKPIILSEFGAGAIYGCRNPQGDPWSEEGQAEVLNETLACYLHHPRIVGAAIWQFCDVRVSREKNESPFNSYGPMGRPRTMNNKGLVDEYRRPKLAYNTVREHFRIAEKKFGTL